MSTYIAALQDKNRRVLLLNIVKALGFAPVAGGYYRGLSGLEHGFEIVGARQNRHLLLVLSGPISLDERSRDPWLALLQQKEKETAPWGPDVSVQEEVWKRLVLLPACDAQAGWGLRGWTIDTLVFYNVFAFFPSRDRGGIAEFRKHVRVTEVPLQCHFDWASRASIPSDLALARLGSSTGACFISLAEILDLVRVTGFNFFARDAEDAQIHKLRHYLTQRRVIQFFEPPTDELLLTAANLAALRPKPSPHIIDAAKLSTKLKHPLSPNVILTDVPHRDPVKVAKELEEHKLIAYEAQTVHVTPNGKMTIEKITKTPQESFVLRLLRILDVPGTVEGIIKGIKHSG